MGKLDAVTTERAAIGRPIGDQYGGRLTYPAVQSTDCSQHYRFRSLRVAGCLLRS
jgi:hypothetical protein